MLLLPLFLLNPWLHVLVPPHLLALTCGGIISQHLHPPENCLLTDFTAHPCLSATGEAACYLGPLALLVAAFIPK